MASLGVGSSIAACRAGVCELTSHEWSSGPVLLGSLHRERRIGLRPVPGAFGILLGARSVHTFGMRDPIGVVAVDSAGTVLAARTMQPRRLWTVLGAAAIIEVPEAAGLPGRGTTLEAVRVRSSVGLTVA